MLVPRPEPDEDIGSCRDVGVLRDPQIALGSLPLPGRRESPMFPLACLNFMSATPPLSVVLENVLEDTGRH